jgi:hypothetical protein
MTMVLKVLSILSVKPGSVTVPGKYKDRQYLATKILPLKVLSHGTVSNCTKNTENVYAHLVIISIWGRKRTLADKTVY